MLKGVGWRSMGRSGVKNVLDLDRAQQTLRNQFIGAYVC